MPKRKRWTVWTSFVCSPEQRAYLDSLCDKKKASRGELIREIIDGMMAKDGVI